MLTSNQMVDDYLNINAGTNTNENLVARCVTGLGPDNSDNKFDNDDLGEWSFGENELLIGECNDSNAVQSSGADISDYVGVIDLLQCGMLTTDTEGIYTCTIMDSSMMEQSVRLGVYFSGRSELLNITQSLSKIVVSTYTRTIMYTFIAPH